MATAGIVESLESRQREWLSDTDVRRWWFREMAKTRMDREDRFPHFIFCMPWSLAVPSSAASEDMRTRWDSLCLRRTSQSCRRNWTLKHGGGSHWPTSNQY